MKIYLVRHVETTHNKEGRYYIDEHDAFTPRGEKQLKALKSYFKDKTLSKVISSPKERCLITSNQLNCSVIESNSLFEDIDMGVYKGLTKEEILKKYSDLEHERLSNLYEFFYPSGESHKQCEERVNFALKEILNNISEDIVIVTHAAPIFLILKRVLNISFSEAKNIFVYPGSVTVLNYSNNILKVESEPQDLIEDDYSELKSLVSKGYD